MKLSMSILADWLSDYQPRTDLKTDLLEIETVRLFSGKEEPRPNTLYIGTLHQLFSNGSNRVICTHKNDILILNTEDVEDVLNQVLTAFEYYSRWADQTQARISEGAMLQDLIDLSEDILRCPVFLLDSGHRMLACSRRYLPQKEDRFWDTMMENKLGDSAIVNQLNTRYPDRLLYQGIYTLDENNFFTSKGYHYNFFYQNSWVGLFAAIDEFGTFRKGKLDIFLIFCHIIDKWFQTHIETQGASELSIALQNALTSNTREHHELNRLLSLWNWKVTDELILVQLTAPYAPYNINIHLCRTINSSVRDIFAIVMENSIAVLCNLSRQNRGSLETSLAKWLLSGKYYGSVSPVFTLKESLYFYYQYTNLTSRYCERIPGEFYDGSSYVLEHLINYLKDAPLPSPYHPGLLKLMDYDTRHHSSYSDTLHVYLEMERNHLATARALNLHRNSLSYRIQKIAQITGADFDDPNTRLHMLISYKLLNQEHNNSRLSGE